MSYSDGQSIMDLEDGRRIIYSHVRLAWVPMGAQITEGIMVGESMTHIDVSVSGSGEHAV